MRHALKTRVTLALCSSLTVAALVFLAEAWAAPTQLPPQGGVDALLDTGSTAQTKSGPLSIQNTLTANSASVTGNVSVGQLCLPGGGCRNSWPAPDYSVPNLPTVLGNGSTVSTPLFGSGFSIYLNGVWRETWPQVYFDGRGGHDYTISDPNNCITSSCHQTTACGGEYYICGAYTDIWGNIDHYACCKMNFKTY